MGEQPKDHIGQCVIISIDLLAMAGKRFDNFKMLSTFHTRINTFVT